MAKGRKEKLDRRITARFHNKHDAEITKILSDTKGICGSRVVWADAARACMCKLEEDVRKDEKLVEHNLSLLRAAGLLATDDNNTSRRDFMVSEAFRKHFSVICLTIGCELSEYIVVAIQIYLSTFARNPDYANSVYSNWEKRNVSRDVSPENDIPKQLCLVCVRGPQNGSASSF